MSPTNFIAAPGPKATAITRIPCDSSSLASASADGDGSARPLTVANAPFTTRKRSPFEPVTVASDMRLPDRTA